MIQLYLHEYVALGADQAKWPETFRLICSEIECQAIPSRREKVNAKMRAELAALEGVIDEAPIVATVAPPEDAPAGSFDRTPLVALEHWAVENDDEWIAKACKFLIKHTGVRIEQRYTDRVFFVEGTMPEGWKHSLSEWADSFGGLLSNLAAHIKKRIEQMGL